MVERGYERVLVLGTPGVAEALAEMGVNCVLPDDEAAHDTDAIYVAWHPECSMPHIHLACERVLDGAAFLTASDVPFFATKDGRSFGYSCAINGAVSRVTGREPEACGKPSALALAMIAEELGMAQEDVGVVGDDAVAEMQMARAGGAIGIAVASGSTSREQWAAQPPEREPHVVIDSVADLLSNGLVD
jgi:4-nitrophenyl phosphatase